MPRLKLFTAFALTACMVGLFSAGALAQGPGRGGPGGGPGGGRMGMGGMGGMGMMGGGPTGLLRMKEVREELKLDEDQVKELEDMEKAMRESFSGMRPEPGQVPDPAAMQQAMEKIRKAMSEAEEKLEEVLDPKQMERLIGLIIQRDNLRALSSKLVADKLAISEDQKTKMAEIEKENMEKMREMFQGGGGGGGGGGGFGPEMREKMKALREESDVKIKALLSDKQKEEMESLKGAEFKFPEPPARGGPGGGRGRRGGDGA